MSRIREERVNGPEQLAHRDRVGQSAGFMLLFVGAFVVGPLEIVGFAHERRDRQPLALEACFDLSGAALANGLARAVGIR